LNLQELKVKTIGILFKMRISFVFDEKISVKSLSQMISDQALNFGEGDPSNKKKPMVN
jgi:hypothetical protein